MVIISNNMPTGFPPLPPLPPVPPLPLASSSSSPSSPSSPSSSTYEFSYDVFLSFRGEDTRSGFAGSLFDALRKMDIITFMDDQEIRLGDEITPTIMDAIAESQISIVIFSENYASSPFCLDELVMIMECKQEGMLVLPVFYKVDPSDVRHQKGSYGEALNKHELRFIHDKDDKVKKWRLALQEAANIAGSHVIKNQGYEYEHIEKIVQEVYERINGSSNSTKVENKKVFHQNNYPPVHKGKSKSNDEVHVMSFLEVQSNDDGVKVMQFVGVRSNKGVDMEGICGIGNQFQNFNLGPSWLTWKIGKEKKRRK